MVVPDLAGHVARHLRCCRQPPTPSTRAHISPACALYAECCYPRRSRTDSHVHPVWVASFSAPHHRKGRWHASHVEFKKKEKGECRARDYFSSALPSPPCRLHGRWVIKLLMHTRSSTLAHYACKIKSPKNTKRAGAWSPSGTI
jgi:hypothetical protein